MDDSTPDPTRDPAELRRRLAALTFDLRTLDLPGFRQWLERQAVRWAADPVFIQRSRIRDIRRAHPVLRVFEAAARRTAEASTATPAGARIATIERELHRVGRAIAGLTEALGRATPERRSALEAKREAFDIRRRELELERDELTQASPERQRHLAAADEFQRARAATGLDVAEAELATLLRGKGRQSGQAGQAFEREALGLVERVIVPDLGEQPQSVRVLRSVRLGAAGVELDYVVVREPGSPDHPVEVLAVVEAKRNINDLGHGFRRRQIDLAWLTGDAAAYQADEHRTGRFPTGHFDRPGVHWEGDRPYLFGPDSFRRFVRDPNSGWFLDRLYLVTRAGPAWGLTGAAMARVAARIATDERWDPTDDGYLTGLFDWCRSLAGPVETPDVLELFSTAERARQLIVTCLERSVSL